MDHLIVCSVRIIWNATKVDILTKYLMIFERDLGPIDYLIMDAREDGSDDH